MKPEVFSVDELHKLRKYYQSYGKFETVKYVPCPICDKLMQRKNWGSHSGVVVLPLPLEAFCIITNPAPIFHHFLLL